MQFNKIKKSVYSIIILSLLSCDRDLNDLGSEVIGENHFGMKRIELDIKGFNQKLENPNTTNLSINPLGVYDNVMGTTIAHYVSQVELSSLVSNIVTPATVVVENVYLEVPYSSTQTDNSTDNPKYLVNNLYPKDVETPTNNKFKLSIFENGYDLRATNTQGQEIYMNEKAKFLPNLRGTDAAGNSVLGGTRLNDDATTTAENDAFFFNNKFVEDTDYISTETTIPTSKVAPKMKIKLNKNYFKKKIFDNTSVLANQDLFKNHFKGLYFHVEEIADSKSMAILNFSEAKIIIQYKDEVTTGNFTKKQYIINVRGISASLQDFSPNSNPLQSYNPVYNVEAPELFLKGGAGGNMIVLGLNNSANSSNPDLKTLLFLKENKDNIIINDAYIEYYIDKNYHNYGTAFNKDKMLLNNPFRSSLYNLPGERTTLDFQIDNSTNSGNRLLDKTIFGGFVDYNSNTNEYFHRIKVTQHLIDIVKSNESFNTTLGIVASNDINSFGVGNQIYKSKLKNEITNLPTYIENNPSHPLNSLNMEQSPAGLRKIVNIPISTVLLPVGSKIYGTNSTDAKRMKLVVYYTEKK